MLSSPFSDAFERYAESRGRMLEIYVSHTPSGRLKIKATSAEDLMAGRFWWFKVGGGWVALPAWFLKLVPKPDKGL